jgi:hypothetical protein
MWPQHWIWFRSHVLTFTLTRISEARHRNWGFVTLSVTISRRFRATICPRRMSGELIRTREICEMNTPRRLDHMN